MSTNERDRLDLRQALEEVFADERIAQIAMDAMPPIDYSQLATKQDLALLSAELRGEMAEFRGEMSDALAQNIKVVILTIMSATVILGGLITTVLG